MPEFLIGSEDDWKNMLEEHPEFAVREEDSLLEEGALSRALAKAANGGERPTKAPAPSVRADEPTLEELLAGAVDLSPGVAFVRERGNGQAAQEQVVEQAETSDDIALAPSKQRVFDLHCDTLDRLCLGQVAAQTMWTDHDADIPLEYRTSLAHNACHLALDRMADYAWCQCFSIFIPDEFRGKAAWDVLCHVRQFFESQMEAHADLVEQVHDAREIEKVLAAGKSAAILTVEGAAFLEDPAFRREGASSAESEGSTVQDEVVSVQSVPGARAKGGRFASSMPGESREEFAARVGKQLGLRDADQAPYDGGLRRIAQLAEVGVKMMTLTWNGSNAVGSGHDTREGLSRFGREVVREMEEHRIVVDVSHLNDRGFSDVVEIATRPLAASHSNARSVCGHRRNLTDAQARTIFEGGGLVGLNYCRDFLTERGGDPTPDDVLRQVDRLLELGGERGLALGSDYDGTDVPTWLEGCGRVGTLHALIERHFGRDLAERIFFENARDFFVRNEG